MPLSPDRVYMLAADHRWQWEEFCDARSLSRERIPDVKRLAYDAFLLARQRSAAVLEFGALLVDAQYSSGVIAEALKHVWRRAHRRVRESARQIPDR